MFDPESLDNVPWLADLLDAPESFAWPRFMSPVHPDAVGSYGADVEGWLRTEQGIEFRWWQKLATRRHLEHDEDGRLVWKRIVESTPRRSGKSTRQCGVASWRMAHPEIFGGRQNVIHTGSDVAICREIQRGIWDWAEQAGWKVTQTNGKEVVESLTHDRWIVRSQRSVTGWTGDLAMVDEGWDVDSATVDENLEPVIMDRPSGQLWLASTAHRRATSLMRRTISTALTRMGEDWRNLLMLWGAPADADIGDIAVWRAANPYWTQDRFELMSDRYERALAGEADPEADDPDPMEGFKAQYLNIWPSPAAPRAATGEPVVTEVDWKEVGGVEPADGQVPAAVAVDSYFSEGVSVASAWPLPGGQVLVRVIDHPNLSEAARSALGAKAPALLVGKTLAEDPVFEGVAVEPVGSTAREMATGFRHLLDDDVLRHDGGELLTGQVLNLRVKRLPEGVRVVSVGRTDAVKTALFAAERARRPVEVPAVY